MKVLRMLVQCCIVICVGGLLTSDLLWAQASKFSAVMPLIQEPTGMPKTSAKMPGIEQTVPQTSASSMPGLAEPTSMPGVPKAGGMPAAHGDESHVVMSAKKALDAVGNALRSAEEKFKMMLRVTRQKIASKAHEVHSAYEEVLTKLAGLHGRAKDYLGFGKKQEQTPVSIPEHKAPTILATMPMDVSQEEE